MRHYILLVIVLATHIGLYSQVTIGSHNAPAKGAILELSEGASTTKGMMLPRVALSALDELKMGENALPTNEYSQHTGLMVYNVTEIENCPSTTSISKGVYTNVIKLRDFILHLFDF